MYHNWHLLDAKLVTYRVYNMVCGHGETPGYDMQLRCGDCGATLLKSQAWVDISTDLQWQIVQLDAQRGRAKAKAKAKAMVKPVVKAKVGAKAQLVFSPLPIPHLRMTLVSP